MPWAKPTLGAVLNRKHPLAVGCTGYWPFSSPAAMRFPDLARGVTCSLLGSSVGWSVSPWGPAVQTAGINGYVSYGSGSTTWPGPNGMSAAVLFSTTQTSLAGSILSRGSSGQYSWALQLTAGGAAQLVLLNSGGSSIETTVQSSNTVNDGKWHWAGFVYGGPVQGGLWCDGKFYPCTSNTGTWYTNSTADVRSGINAAGATQFTGQIACTAIWNRMLGAPEMLSWAGDPYALAYTDDLLQWAAATALVPLTESVASAYGIGLHVAGQQSSGFAAALQAAGGASSAYAAAIHADRGFTSAFGASLGMSSQQASAFSHALQVSANVPASFGVGIALTDGHSSAVGVSQVGVVAWASAFGTALGMSSQQASIFGKAVAVRLGATSAYSVDMMRMFAAYYYSLVVSRLED